MMSKKAQSELVGFGIIVIIVSILILIFISFSISNSGDEVGNYETEDFIQSVIQYTTSCARNSETNYLPYLDLVRACSNNEMCFDGSRACEVLNQTSYLIVDNSWETGEDYPVKGYNFKTSYQGVDLVTLSKGSVTSQNKGSIQVFSESLQVVFTAYY
ncbi:MAG: hypothetical protein KKB62_03625 [Nanoarchaeota archaeon]|nr:hypothetical protein [Nanoarchaeota archaeon]